MDHRVGGVDDIAAGKDLGLFRTPDPDPQAFIDGQDRSLGLRGPLEVIEERPFTDGG